MITGDDGRYCRCGEYFDPWFIRKIIAEGDEKTYCCTCNRFIDIDELLDSGEYKELNE